MKLLEPSQTQCTEIWDFILEKHAWPRAVLNAKVEGANPPIPCLLGQHLVRISHGNTKEAHLALLINDWTGSCYGMHKLFFECLKDHKYDEMKREVFLTESGITLHIVDAISSVDEVRIFDLKKIVGSNWRRPFTYALYYNDTAPEKIDGTLIRGVDGVRLRKKRAVSEICSIGLKYRNGSTVWRIFIDRDKSIRVMPKKNISGDIIGWRLSREGEGDYN